MRTTGPVQAKLSSQFQCMRRRGAPRPGGHAGCTEATRPAANRRRPRTPTEAACSTELILLGFLSPRLSPAPGRPTPPRPGARLRTRHVGLPRSRPFPAPPTVPRRPGGRRGRRQGAALLRAVGRLPGGHHQDGAAVTLDDLAEALGRRARGARGKQQAGKQDPTAIVNRLVDAKLVVMEADAMGIDDLPEVKEGVKAAEESIGREMLKERVLADVQPDPAEVDRLYKEKVREWKLQSVLFAREDDAKAMAKAAQGRQEVRRARRQGASPTRRPRGTSPGQFVHASKLVLRRGWPRSRRRRSGRPRRR